MTQKLGEHLVVCARNVKTLFSTKIHDSIKRLKEKPISGRMNYLSSSENIPCAHPIILIVLMEQNIVEQTETNSSYLFSWARVVTCNSWHSVVTYSEDLQVWDIFQQLGDLSESIERQVQGAEPGNHNTSVLKNTKTSGIWQNIDSRVAKKIGFNKT